MLASTDSGWVALGPIEFELGAARVERRHWVVAQAGRVQRQLILQRERMVEAGKRYTWTVEHPVVVEGLEWDCGVWVWSVAEFAAEAGAEVARTDAFLRSHGYEQADGQLTARYARVLGSDRRREEIVFYQEDLGALGLTLGEVADDEGELRPAHRGLAGGLLDRSRAAFALLRHELADA